MELMSRTQRNWRANRAARRVTAALTLAASAAVVAAVFTLWLAGVKAEDAGMAPAVAKGDIILFDRLSKYAVSPKRGDVIAFLGEDGALYLGRIVAMGGERVELALGRVYINGMLLDESGYISTPCPDMAETAVPAGAYLVLPDTRREADVSNPDSLIVRAEDILGRAAVRVYPPGRLALFG